MLLSRAFILVTPHRVNTMPYTVAQTSEDVAETATVMASSGSSGPVSGRRYLCCGFHELSAALHLMASRMNFPATAWRWGALSHDSRQHVADIIEKPPQENLYVVIKHRLLGAISDYLWTE